MMNAPEPYQNIKDDREPLSESWRQHGDAIRRYCATRLGREWGEDVAQEVFLAAWHYWPDSRQDQPLRPWLFGIARHKCLHAWRDHHRRQALKQAGAEDIRMSTHAPESMSLEVQVAQKSQQQRLLQQMSHLSVDEQLLLQWWYWQGYALPDIATRLGKSVPIVRKRLNRAHRRLQQLMVTPSDTPDAAR